MYVPAFSNVKVIGIAQFANRPINRTGQLVYSFSEINENLVSTLNFGPLTDQKFTIVAEELGVKTCWSRGIKNIYFI